MKNTARVCHTEMFTAYVTTFSFSSLLLLSYDNVFLMSELGKIAFCADAVDEWNCNYLSPAHNSYSSSSNYSGQRMHIYQASMCMTFSRKFLLTHNELNWRIRLRIVLRSFSMPTDFLHQPSHYQGFQSCCAAKLFLASLKICSEWKGNGKVRISCRWEKESFSLIRFSIERFEWGSAERETKVEWKSKYLPFQFVYGNFLFTGSIQRFNFSHTISALIRDTMQICQKRAKRGGRSGGWKTLISAAKIFHLRLVRVWCGDDEDFFSEIWDTLSIFAENSLLPLELRSILMSWE